ncbi:MAG: hypothetical protein QM820_63115 [Minicystis sp.]
MGVAVPLSRIGLKLLDEIERGALSARAAAPRGARIRVAEIAIPFATADGSAPPPAVFPQKGEAGLPDEARAWLSSLESVAVVAAGDVEKADPGARGRLVIRVDFGGGGAAS